MKKKIKCISKRTLKEIAMHLIYLRRKQKRKIKPKQVIDKYIL